MTNVVELAVATKPAVPEFITASDIDAMTDDELDTMLAAIRTRRMNSYLIYKQTKDEKDQLERDKARLKIEKKCEQIIKVLNAIDDRMEKLETRINELRGLRLQAGMELV